MSLAACGSMTYQWTGEDPRPEFDEELATTLVGKYILVGVTYFAHFGRELERLQMHGIVESASAEGIRIALRGQREGETWVMAPVLDAIEPASPGAYALHATGEVIEDPAFISTWSVTKPCQH